MLGGTYALLGIGLTLIFGIMRVVNFTHGELYAFGAYMMYMLVMLTGANFFVALVLALALGVALGAAIEFVLLRKLRGADIDTTMLVMIGAWIALQNAEQLAWTGVAQSIDSPFPSAPLVIGPVSVSWGRVFVFCAALALIDNDQAWRTPNSAFTGAKGVGSGFLLPELPQAASTPSRQAPATRRQVRPALRGKTTDITVFSPWSQHLRPPQRPARPAWPRPIGGSPHRHPCHGRQPGRRP